MNPNLLHRVEMHWAGRLGCKLDVLQEPGLHLLPEPREDAVYVVDLGETVIVCAPARYREQLAAELPTERLVSRENLSRLLPAPTRLIGPAFVGYAASVARVGRSAEELPNATAPAFDALRRAASTEEWEHAGLDEHAGPIFVELADGDVIAAAGYQRIAGELAHIGVLTHPDHRAAGRGRKVVAAAAERAISLGLMAQYQTLLANTSAIAIARSLGFERFATTIAAHLPVGADD